MLMPHAMPAPPSHSVPRARRLQGANRRARLLAPTLAACMLLGAGAGAGAALGGGSAAAASDGVARLGLPKQPARRGPRAAASVRFSTVTLDVPAGNGASPFNVAHALTVPAGWSATVWARVRDARFEVWTPQHELLVSDSEGGDLVELIPRRGSAAARERVIASGLEGPQGLAFDTLKGVRVLYVAEYGQLVRYVWKRTGLLGARTVVARNLPNLGPGGTNGSDVHQAKSIAIARNHTIYITAGSASNATPEPPGQSPPRATILAVRPNGSGLSVFASGVRNGEGLSFAPDGTLWTAVNERDEIAYPFHAPFGSLGEAFGAVITDYVNEHPPDELARLTPGRNLGWPYCDPDPDVTPGAASSALRFANLPFDPDAQTNPGGGAMNCAALAPIERGLPAHSAPLGFHFLEGSAIPAPWSGGAVVAVHGSWDRQPPRPPAVLWLPWLAGARTLGESMPLVSGFQLPSGERWGRPADAVAGPEGALYVTDDTAGAVYRIAPPHR